MTYKSQVALPDCRSEIADLTVDWLDVQPMKLYKKVDWCKVIARENQNQTREGTLR